MYVVDSNKPDCNMDLHFLVLIFSAGACPVDATDHKGLTPLMMACMFGRSLMAAYLLGRGAEPNLTDMNGDSALHWSAYKGFPALMQVPDQICITTRSCLTYFS